MMESRLKSLKCEYWKEIATINMPHNFKHTYINLLIYEILLYFMFIYE